MIQTFERLIDGDNFMVTQLPARRAIKLKIKLGKLFGAGLVQFLTTATDKEESQDLGKDSDGNPISISAEQRLADSQIRELRKTSLVKSVQLMVENLSDKTFDDLLTDLLPGVRKNGIELTLNMIDVDFAGKLEVLYKLILYILEVNFGSFFDLSGIGNLFDTNPQAKNQTSTNLTWPQS